MEMPVLGLGASLLGAGLKAACQARNFHQLWHSPRQRLTKVVWLAVAAEFVWHVI